MENDENMCAFEDDSCVKDHEGLDDVLIKKVRISFALKTAIE